MINTDCFKNKKVLVVGFARSGLACANLLYELGVDVSITDNKDCDSTRANLLKLKSSKINPVRNTTHTNSNVIVSNGIRVELGKHSQGFIKDKDLLVISPGVTNSALPIVWAEQLNIPVISEIELAWMLCPAAIIAVTGSSGKTTVTTLIGEIIEASGKRAFVCGNIGNPFSDEVHKMASQDFVSLETSSFQLERIRNFKPKISVILNFSRNHLDRHRDIQEYLDAKKRIFMNQDDSDFLVLNGRDPILKNLAGETKAKVLFFFESQDLNPNQAAVVTVGSILGIEKNTCLKVFREFKGLEHRFEYVTEINNIKFINDSKSTLVESTIWAIKNISSPVILIAGGKDKGVDYKGILDIAAKRVKEVILIGEAKEKIKKEFNGFLSLDEAYTLEEAVNKAYLKAKPGDSVLLSPMCSSFDMFSNYEERGDRFKKAVLNLAKAKG